MNHNGGRSLAEIKRETEQSRAALTSTVQELKGKVTDTADEWRERVSPDAIKSNVKDYVSSRSNEFTASLMQSAKDNPLQALAVGAGLAIPAFRLLRSIPAPILMIGAGLFLSNTKKGQDLSERAQESMSDAASAATRKMHDIQDAVSKTVNSGLDTLGNAKSAVNEKTQTLASHATSISESALSAVQELSGQVTSSASMALEKSDGKAAVHSVSNAIRNNALLVAGIGLAIGGFIASVLPKSDAEQKLLGGTSDKLKEQVQGVVTGAVDTARTAAVAAFDELTDRAAEQGLSPERLSETTSDIGGRMRKVADAASTAAFGENRTSVSGQGIKQ